MKTAALASASAALLASACSASVSVGSRSAPSPTGPAWPVVQRFTFDGPHQRSPAVYLAAGQAWVASDCVGHPQQTATFQLYPMGNHVVSDTPILSARVTKAPGRYFEVDLGESYELVGSLLGDAKCTVTLRQR